MPVACGARKDGAMQSRRVCVAEDQGAGVTWGKRWLRAQLLVAGSQGQTTSA